MYRGSKYQLSFSLTPNNQYLHQSLMYTHSRWQDGSICCMQNHDEGCFTKMKPFSELTMSVWELTFVTWTHWNTPWSVRLHTKRDKGPFFEPSMRCVQSDLSSLRSLSSNSWILLSSRLIPAVGRVCPSMSAIRDFSSFIWERTGGGQWGE